MCNLFYPYDVEFQYSLILNLNLTAEESTDGFNVPKQLTGLNDYMLLNLKGIFKWLWITKSISCLRRMNHSIIQADI